MKKFLLGFLRALATIVSFVLLMFGEILTAVFFLLLNISFESESVSIQWTDCRILGTSPTWWATLILAVNFYSYGFFIKPKDKSHAKNGFIGMTAMETMKIVWYTFLLSSRMGSDGRVITRCDPMLLGLIIVGMIVAWEFKPTKWTNDDAEKKEEKK